MDDYKHEKELFVSNLEGTSFGQVLSILAVAPLSAALYRLVMNLLRSGDTLGCASWSQLSICSFVFCFLLQIVPLMIAFTTTHHLLLYGGMIGLCVILVLYARLKGRPVSAFTTSERVAIESFNGTGSRGSKGFLTTYRGYLAMGTCFSILAVDFIVFPRGNAKTESVGISLMDIGVGSFVLSHAYTFGHSKPYWNRFIAGVPMIVMGFIRLAMVKASGYQEHVTEYGMHWNFFFTLALLSLVAPLFGFFCFPNYQLYVGVLLLLVHQIELSVYLGDELLDPSRGDTIWSQNKEGIESFVGYLALFLIGANEGLTLTEFLPGIDKWWVRCLKTFGQFIVYTVLALLSDTYIQPFSRKMANLSYVLGVLALNSFTVASMMLVDLLIRPPHSIPETAAPRKTHRLNGGNSEDNTIDYGLIQCFSRNQLGLFLAANLLTGLINLSMQTIHATTEVAWATLGGYMLFLSAVAFVLNGMDITLRLRR